jgi:hypothetical protein
MERAQFLGHINYSYPQLFNQTKSDPLPALHISRQIKLRLSQNWAQRSLTNGRKRSYTIRQYMSLRMRRMNFKLSKLTASLCIQCALINFTLGHSWLIILWSSRDGRAGNCLKLRASSMSCFTFRLMINFKHTYTKPWSEQIIMSLSQIWALITPEDVRRIK